MKLLLTCEHAGNKIPAPLRSAFRGQAQLLASHRGWDPGALRAARALARRFDAPLLSTEISRLVVDTNRSARHPQAVGDFAGHARRDLLARYWQPHRQAVEAAVAAQRPCLHVAVHSFTPRLHGETRNADVGLLYDPARPNERALALCWQDALRRLAPQLRVRRNYPYRGRADGLPTHLRTLHADADYAGFELELNQAMWRGAGAREGPRIIALVGEALATAREA
jgi:predicted N-formylglutamate amidohydrolase